MNLSNVDISKLITNSKIQLDKKTKSKNTVFLIGGAVSSLVFMLSACSWNLFLVLALCLIGKPTYHYLKCGMKRLYANIGLRRLAKNLRKKGIKTTRLQLQKANTYVTRNYQENDLGKYGVETVYTTVFKDHKGLLKALRQTKQEILICDPNKDWNQETVFEESGNHRVEIINAEETVKKLILEKKLGKKQNLT